MAAFIASAPGWSGLIQALLVATYMYKFLGLFLRTV